MNTVTFRYGPQICAHLDSGANREWLVADGRGGYAMGTVSGLRTRRYHGLLVVPGATVDGGPARRMLAVAALDAVLTLESGAKISLATHEWTSGAISPAGHELLESFDLRDGVPTWRWRVGEVVIERTLACHRGRSAVAVSHRLLAGGPVTLSVEALCTWRDAHGERYESPLELRPTTDGVVVAGSYRLAGPGFTADQQWYRGAFYRVEAERGLAASEDLCRVGRFTADLRTGRCLDISAWAGPPEVLAVSPPPVGEVIAAARTRHRALTAKAGGDTVEAALRLAADAFIIDGGAAGGSGDDGGDIGGAGGPDVIAGYPWFGAWSRDTMIAYEGLFLATDRWTEGRDLLRSYAATVSRGMLANTADTGTTEYNTADASLWLPHAVARHVDVTGDIDLGAELLGALDEVIDWHLHGTRYGIGVDPIDGLLRQGAPGYALTWMDAVVDGIACTARQGKAVELNALWINGLRAVGRLHERMRERKHERIGATAAVQSEQSSARRDHEDRSALLTGLADRATDAFRRRFPAPTGWLHDVVDSPEPGGESLRPNQLLAYSLPFGPMRGGDPGPVRAVGHALLTPLGLRTLAPDDPAFHARHRGDPAGRDRAYHQGTVWPWLIGAYADAVRAVAAEPGQAGVAGDGGARGLAGGATDDLLDGLVAHLAEWGVGSVSETADGTAPHDATGCPFQAWSVAEMLRTYRSM